MRFREANYKPEQLRFLSREYHEDLVDEQVTPEQFHAAVKIVRKRCRFFPKMVEILEAVREHRSKPPAPSNRLQIAEHTHLGDKTPEDIAKAKKRLRAISSMIAGKITLEEALEITSPEMPKSAIDNIVKGAINSGGFIKTEYGTRGAILHKIEG
ncbi:MAG: hypothetical protein DRH10_00620 [Deltaproteobacteria bacterium]|nr:MAG: hypothetical protein DRH10_00620 [Deltaproteobacteria bacterium]